MDEDLDVDNRYTLSAPYVITIQNQEIF